MQELLKYMRFFLKIHKKIYVGGTGGGGKAGRRIHFWVLLHRDHEIFAELLVRHKLLQQSIIKDGGLLFHILVETFDEKSQSGQLLQLCIVFPLVNALETRVNSPQRNPQTGTLFFGTVSDSLDW